jgi:hypothetical protein
MSIVAPLLFALPMIGIALWTLRAFWIGLKKGELKDIWKGSPAVNRIDQPFFYCFFFVIYVAQIGVFGFIGIGALGLTAKSTIAALGLQ